MREFKTATTPITLINNHLIKKTDLKNSYFLICLFVFGPYKLSHSWVELYQSYSNVKRGLINTKIEVWKVKKWGQCGLTVS